MTWKHVLLIIVAGAIILIPIMTKDCSEKVIERLAFVSSSIVIGVMGHAGNSGKNNN